MRIHDHTPRNWYVGLDGVRAVAVSLVYCVHYIGYLTGYVGWTGVLIFFVLSGFLITGLLYDNINEPFRFRNFYIRRTLRIFPLFYFAWVLVLIAGLLLHARWDPMHILWLTYLGNYVRFIVGSLAMDHILTSNPKVSLEIGHFWSLAVEEQFYLVWPLVVFYVRKRETLIQICICAVILVPILRTAFLLVLSQNMLSMEFSYRMIFTQCDGFLLGGLMALWMRGPEKERLLRHSGKLLYCSIIAIIAAYYLFHKPAIIGLVSTTPWMSSFGYTLIDLMAAGLILSSLRPGIVFRIMATWPLRILGRYSYGFYVYHVLLLPFLTYYIRPLAGEPHSVHQLLNTLLFTILYFFIVLAVSAASYHFVERPFLSLKDRFTVRRRNPDAQKLALTE